MSRGQICALLLTLSIQLVPSMAPIVQSRDDFSGLNLKSIDINVRSNNDSEVYADLMYLNTNTSVPFIAVANLSGNPCTAKPNDTSAGIVSSMSTRATSDVSTVNIVSFLHKSETDNSTNGTFHGSEGSKAFDFYNCMLGVISLIQIFLLTLLVLCSRWECILAVLTCSRKDLCKHKLDQVRMQNNKSSDHISGASSNSNLGLRSIFSHVKKPVQNQQLSQSNVVVDQQIERTASKQSSTKEARVECSSESSSDKTNPAQEPRRQQSAKEEQSTEQGTADIDSPAETSSPSSSPETSTSPSLSSDEVKDSSEPLEQFSFTLMPSMIEAF